MRKKGKKPLLITPKTLQYFTIGPSSFKNTVQLVFFFFWPCSYNKSPELKPDTLFCHMSQNESKVCDHLSNQWS